VRDIGSSPQKENEEKTVEKESLSIFVDVCRYFVPKAIDRKRSAPYIFRQMQLFET
jgi:hypothetical protein